MIAVSLLLLAVGLAMDAVAAAIAQGASGRVRGGGALRIAGAFGFAQGVMPAIGWGLGVAFASAIRSVDHWIALVLLSALGLKMLKEAFEREGEPAPPLSGWALFVAAVATSIDAAAAGITLPMLGAPLLLSCLTIGATTALLSFGGVYLGAAAGNRLGKAADVLGGLILIGLGIKIFIEHQFLGG